MALIIGLTGAIIVSATASVIAVLVVRQHTPVGELASGEVTGPTGDRGAQGSPGDTGTNLPITGPIGSTGLIGISSNQTGPASPTGNLTGPTGPSGGVSNITGSTGPTGVQGFTGVGTVTGPTGGLNASFTPVAFGYHYFTDSLGRYWPVTGELIGAMFQGGPTTYLASTTNLPASSNGFPLRLRLVPISGISPLFATGTVMTVGEISGIVFPSHSKLVVTRALIEPDVFDLQIVSPAGVITLFTPLANILGTGALLWSVTTPL